MTMSTLVPVQVSGLHRSIRLVRVVVVAVQVPAVQAVAVDVNCYRTGFSIKVTLLRSSTKQQIFFDIKHKSESFWDSLFFWSPPPCVKNLTQRFAILILFA